MLQIDLLVSYGLTSVIALVSRKKLVREKSLWINKYFVVTILWLTMTFAPQVVYLCWRFPAWESMFVARDGTEYPPWLASLASIGMIVMGVLGFIITASLVKKGRLNAAVAQAVWSLGLTGLLVTYGWDGTGWKRMLYAGSGADWAAGIEYPIADFFAGPIAMTLILVEALVVVPYCIIFFLFLKESRPKTKK